MSKTDGKFGSIINADMFDALDGVQDKSIDLVILDPPYGIGNIPLTLKSRNFNKSAEIWDEFDDYAFQVDFYDKIIKAISPKLKEISSVITFGTFHNIYTFGHLYRSMGWKTINSIIWYKRNAMFSLTRSSLIESSEQMIWNSPTGKYHFNYEKSVEYADKQMRNVWIDSQTPTLERVGHPTRNQNGS